MKAISKQPARLAQAAQFGELSVYANIVAVPLEKPLIVGPSSVRYAPFPIVQGSATSSLPCLWLLGMFRQEYPSRKS
jgi:hypothetical protein